MYCKNCGNQIADNAAVCLSCGVAVGNGSAYCPNCGSAAQPGAVICTNCGVSFGPVPAPAGAKSKLTAGLLGIFLGAFGVHNFYLGYTGKAIAQLLIAVLTCGIGAAATSIWGLIEGIMILCGKIEVDGKGNALAE